MGKMFFSVNQLNVPIGICLILVAGSSCLAEQKRLSSADGDFEVTYYEYAPEDEQTVVRTVVIFPPTGGITCLDKSYARKIKKRGARAIVLSDWTGKSEDSQFTEGLQTVGIGKCAHYPIQPWFITRPGYLVIPEFG